MEKRVTSEQVLYFRQGFYDGIYSEFLRRNRELVKEYGSWKQIPRKLKKQQFRNLRLSGFTYSPGSGWSGPNSVDLCSIHSK